MKTQSALDLIDENWIEFPNSSDLEAAFLSNESQSIIDVWYQLTDSKPNDEDGHSLHYKSWVYFDTKDGNSLWLKPKRTILSGESCRVRLSA